MADTKITALTALTAADPANDVIPIVDVSDTSMAASGTTKKISVNNILSSSPTASGALTVTGLVTAGSATITGDLTVDTSTLKVDSTLNKVGIGVATLTGLSTLNVAGDVAITSDLVLKNGSGTAQGYIFGSSGINYRVIASNPHVWQEGGTDLMRLNSTGLGIGASPSQRLHVKLDQNAYTFSRIDNQNASSGAYAGLMLSASGNSWGIGVGSTAANSNALDFFLDAGGANLLKMRIDSSGNVGIGVTPATAVPNNRKLEIVGAINSAVVLGTNSSNASARNWATVSNWNTYGDLAFLQSNALGGDPLASGAGTTRMTLDASGNLILLSSNTPATLTTNGQLTVNATSNTNLRFSYRGSDGTTRVANITLA